MGLIDLDAVEWWTYDLVRDVLVETAALWVRSPGEGRSPFATDGPWALMLREVAAGDYDARGGFDGSSAVSLRPLPLSREDVERRDRVSEWLLLVPDAFDRRLMAECLAWYARGYRQLPWARIMRRMGVERGQEGLKKRWQRAVSAIAVSLNAAEIRGPMVSRGQM